MTNNVNQAEVAKFNALAQDWWDPEGAFQPLHDLNPVRLGFVETFHPLAGSKVLDVGCGAGILSEAMAAAGAQVTGIDLAEAALKVAKTHAQEHGADVDYQLSSVEQFAEQHAGEFDAVTCLEMLEHVPDPASAISAAQRCLRSGGHLFLSTINRTPAAFGQAIVGAEYLLGLLPKGTHVYRDFLRPSELDRACRAERLHRIEIQGLGYQPFARRAWLHDSLSVNYIACYKKP